DHPRSGPRRGAGPAPGGHVQGAGRRIGPRARAAAEPAAPVHPAADQRGPFPGLATPGLRGAARGGPRPGARERPGGGRHPRGSVPWRTTPFLAVDDVSYEIERGTTTAIVGESGSGKSTVAQMVLKLLEPTEGRVLFEGRDVTTFTGRDLKTLRRRVQPIFQNPYGTLDPLYSIFRTIEEPLRLHGIGDAKSREAKVRDLLDKVALPSAMMRRYPNELSGGQRQRIAIARALALDPEVVICDEAVSALDVLVQAQVLELLNDLQAELGLSYLFITHDLAVVRQIADSTVVMEKGKVVE